RASSAASERSRPRAVDVRYESRDRHRPRPTAFRETMRSAPSGSATRLRPLPVPDAEILWLPRLALPEPDDVVLARLVEATPWRQEAVTVWGRRHLQPRLSAWYGDPGARYRYSGLDLEPL